ncbi:MAG: DUF362 domain-containing protein [Bryobacteraceae bacterium]
MNRRKFMGLVGVGAGAGILSVEASRSGDGVPEAGPPGKSPVAVLKAASYEEDLVAKILEGARLCGLNVRGKRVLLKPNLVEFDSATAINTDMAVLASALEAFRALGAAEVRIGEGPGHRRDTLGLAEEARYLHGIRDFEGVFTDLNRDDVRPVEGFAGERFYFPQSALGADLIVSVAKMKTHHWAGATLSMKNLFGLVPGAVSKYLRAGGWHRGHGGQRAHSGTTEACRSAGDGAGSRGSGFHLLPHYGYRSHEGGVFEAGLRAGACAGKRHRSARRVPARRAHQF